MELVTARCRVRRFTPSDVDSAGYLADEQVMRFVEPAFTRVAIERFIREAGLCEPPLIHAVERLADGELLGHVIFHSWGSQSTWELGWILRRDCLGQGLATELGRALIAHGFDQFGLDRVVAEAMPENLTSIAVMTKLGMVRSPQLDGDLPVWSISS